MIQPAPTPTIADGASPPRPVRPAHRRPPVWRRPRVLVAGLAGLLVVGLVGAGLSSSHSAPPPAPTPVSAPLIAHGQIVPARQAHVGTQGGGVVQQLSVSVGSQVAAQTPLAWVIGPNGTEIVTAPFDGWVTNVLVHEGDTLAPAAPIAVVADIHSLQVETSDVDEFLIGNVSVGQHVQMTVDALDNEMLTGTVSSIALLPQAETTGGSEDYPVTIALGSIPADVRAGMSVRVTFPD